MATSKSLRGLWDVSFERAEDEGGVLDRKRRWEEIGVSIAFGHGRSGLGSLKPSSMSESHFMGEKMLLLRMSNFEM